MLPVKLRLENFMSYGEPAQELDFSAFRVACISGNNGEGKSALLDAITWALWGIARGTDARGAGADDLIRLGAQETAVSFEFKTEEASWRVTRKRRRGRPGGGLSLSRESKGTWQDAGGATATLTQARINELLGLDYQTFINSAFLLQGRADEFTRQNATERKEILADILNLGLFQKLSERARAAARTAKTRADLLELDIARLTEETASEAEIKEQLQQAEGRLAEIHKTLDARQQAAAAQEKAVRSLEQKQQRAADLERQLSAAGRNQEALAQERAAARARVAECEKLLSRAEEIKAQFAQLQESRQAESRWGEKLSQFAELSQAREGHAAAVAQEQSKLEARAAWLAAEIEKQQARAATAPIEQTIKSLNTETASLEAAQAQAETAQKDLQQARAQTARLAERLQSLETSLRDKQETLGLLQQAGAACPVCRQELTAEGRASLVAESRAEIEKLASAKTAAQKELGAINARITKQETALQKSEDAAARLAQVKQELGRQENMLTSAQAAAKQLAAAKAERREIAATLKREAYATAARRALAAVDKEITALAYDAAAHQAATARARALAPFEKEKAQLDQAQALLDERRANVERVEAALGAADKESTALQKELEGAHAQAQGLNAAQAQLDALNAEIKSHERLARDLEKDAAVKKSQLQRLQESRKALMARQKEKEAALESQVVHADLAAAFGTKGVQALIIETALPQLENHANRLLERLTQGRLQVSFVTQKERSGEMAETLEIRIRDENGERRYEMYSGGEAFRLNFAIRLALSELLASRVGARLSTLVIDEGFGSQDTEGRQRLIEAIRTIASDFDKILVITHIDELKAEFPHRIEVSKDEGGSRIRQISL